MLDDHEIAQYSRELGVDMGDEEAGSSDNSIKENKKLEEDLMPNRNAQA
jgi:hypothetical protein